MRPDPRNVSGLAVPQRDLVLVPRGYHIVAAAAEYEIYYLNVLAGPKRALGTTLDPDHAWIMQAWAQPGTLDPD